MAESKVLQTVNDALERNNAKQRAKAEGLIFIDLRTLQINFDTLQSIDQSTAEKYQVLPIKKVGDDLYIAAVDPLSDAYKAFVKQQEKKGFEIKTRMCTLNDWLEGMSAYESDRFKKRRLVTERQTDVNKKNKKEVLLAFQKELPHLSIPEIWTGILTLAVQLKSSDIHIQPARDIGLELRFRLDGVLVSALNVSKKQALQLLTHIKYTAGLQSNIASIPQDGHDTFRYKDRTVELRIATLPTPEGEAATIRVLDSSKGILPLKALGFLPYQRDLIANASSMPNGLILVTGPTGSGKTTTLYSILSSLNTSDRKIVTLEDPVEYHLDNIVQSQVDENHDYTFSTGLKALLRHDPDVILVGEIRTSETAELAIQAALTGHLVVSTMHTNNAIGAITRLRNLGISGWNIAAVLRLIIAQRLVRKVVHSLAETLPIDAAVNELIGRYEPYILERPKALYETKKEFGYDGRMVLAEALLVDTSLKELIHNESGEVSIEKSVRSDGFLDFRDDAHIKILQGLTTPSEVLRILGKE